MKTSNYKMLTKKCKTQKPNSVAVEKRGKKKIAESSKEMWEEGKGKFIAVTDKTNNENDMTMKEGWSQLPSILFSCYNKI